MNDKLSDTMKKLLELSKRGVDGEKENAEKLLTKMMKKYHISKEDLEKEDIKEFKIVYKDSFDEKLCCQVYYKVTKNLSYRKMRDNRYRTLIFEMTDAQFIEFQYQLEIYREKWNQELDIFMEAFIGKNDIYPKLTEEERKEIEKQVGKNKQERPDWNRMRKVSAMAMGIDFNSVNKAIENK